MNSYETVNNILVRLFKDILDIEERALITSEYKDISVNDMHIMEAIGIQESKNMSTVAKTMSVTVGTLTIAINHLVKKGYVERTRSEEDRRVVLVSLSEKGEKAYLHHKIFHEKMVMAVLDSLNPQETKDLTKALLKLHLLFVSEFTAAEWPFSLTVSFWRCFCMYFCSTGNWTGPISRRYW